MSVGKISVELELKDGQFVGRFKASQAAVKEFASSIDQLNSHIGKVESSIGGVLPKMRDIGVVLLSARTIIRGVNDTFGAFTSGVIKASSEMEKFSVLLKGLSKADSEQGRIKEATNDVKALIEQAQRAPFSLKELSNSFVKMKSAGLEDVEGKVKSLSNAIARFGGNDEALHRATVAIQQMASKGVVSMEELRQQLGEAVPETMKLMADGLNMSIGDMVAAISKGRVKAVPAIEAMMSEMERSMGGSSARMMETWSGMVAQLQTRWMLLQKTIGDSGFFDAAKQSIKELVDAMGSDAALRFAQATGDMLHSAIELSRSAASGMREYGDAILGVVKAAAALYVGLKAITGTTALFESISGLMGGKFVANMKAATAASKTTTTVTMGGLMNLEKQVVTTVTSVGLLSRAFGGMGVVVEALGGPIAVTIGLAAAAITAYAEFANKANESLERVKNSQRELNENGEIKVKLVTKEQITEARDGFQDLVEEKRRAIEELNRLSVAKERNLPLMGDIDKRMEEMRDKIKAINEQIYNSEQGISDSQIALIKRAAEQRVTETERALDRENAKFSASYQERMDIARKARDEGLEIARKTGADETEIVERFSKEHIAAAVEYTSASVAANQKMAEDYKQRLQEMAAASASVKEMLEIKTSLKIEMENKQALLDDIEKLKVAIANAAPEEKLRLAPRLEEAQQKLRETEDRLDSFRGKLDQIMANPIDQSIIDAYGIAQALDMVTGHVFNLQGKLDQLRNNPVSASALIDTTGLEEQTKKVEKLVDIYNQQKVKIAQLQEEVQSVGKGDVAKVMQRVAKVIGDPNKPDAVLDSLDKARQKGVSPQEQQSQMRAAIQAKAELTQKLEVEKELKETFLELQKRTASKTARFAHAKDNRNSDYDFTKVDQLAQKMREAGKSTEEVNKAVADLKKEIAKGDEVKRASENWRRSMSASKKAATEAENDRKRAAREAKQQQEKEEHERLRREKWLAGQINQIEHGISQAQISNMQDGVQVEKAAVDARIAEIRRLAKAEAEATGLTGDAIVAFMNRAENDTRGKILEERKLQNAHDAAERMKAIDAEIFDSKNNLIESSLEREKAALQHRFELLTTDAQKSIHVEEDKQAYLKKLSELQESEMANITKAHRTAFDEMMAQNANFSENFRQTMGNFAVEGVDALSSSIAELATTGKQNFADFAQSVIKAVEMMIIKMLILKAIELALSVLGYGGTVGGAYENGGTTATTAYAKGGTIPVKAYAEGGMTEQLARQLSSASFMNAADMKRGGVKNRPQVALFAEGSTPEAFIPMRDGKNIPLALSRDQSGNITAMVPLPSGKTIPAKIVQDSTGVQTFADGGVIGGVKSVASGTQGGSGRVLDVLLSIDRAIGKMSHRIVSGPSLEAAVGIPNLTVANGRRDRGGNALGTTTAAAGSTRGDNITINLAVHDNSDSSKKSDKQGDPSGKDKAEAWDKMSDRIKQVVRTEIVEQRRPGGVLWR